MKRSLAAIGLLLISSGCAFDGVPPAYDPSAAQSLRIPGGQRCLALLSELGVRHRVSPRAGHMLTPVEVLSDIAGVTYRGAASAPLRCDCRLVLALHWAAPVFRAWGVTEIEHFGAFSNRTTRSGRASMHAFGLALDVAHVHFPDGRRSVLGDYMQGLGDGCSKEAPVLNRLVCDLRSLGLFRELITPDHDFDHRDHVHLSIIPL